VQLLNPGRPRDGNSAIADQGFRPFCFLAFDADQMAFVNEVVSDEDIAKYNLPFKPGAGRYWTRNKERDCYLWGGILDGFAYGYEQEGQFEFYWKGTLLRITLDMGSGSSSFQDSPYRIVWNKVTHIQPFDLGGLSKRDVFSLLKDALMAYGYDGRMNVFAQERQIDFNF
jgi:hypothetical protein